MYEWVKNITGYFLFLAVVEHLIPGKKYEKYFHLFAGMIAILLVLQPFGKNLGLDERIAHFYETLVFQYQAEDLREQFLGIEQERLEQMISQYEEAVADDIRQMAGELGLTTFHCQVQIEREEGTEQFGKVVKIWLVVSAEEEEREGTMAEEREAVSENGEIIRSEDVVVIEPITIPAGEGEKATKEEQKESRRKQEVEYSIIRRLRRKIASYYDLEEAYVEIQTMEG